MQPTLSGRSLRAPVILAALVAIAAGAWAQQDETTEVLELYSLGDQTFTINLGTALPMRFRTIEPIGGETVHPSNLTLGAVLGIEWSSYLNGQVSIGAETGVSFAWDINGTPLLSAPLLFRAGYTFGFFPYELPVELGLGVSLLKLVDKFSFAYVLQPAAGLLWKFSSDWAFGGRVSYRLSYEPAVGGKPAAERAFGGSVDINLRAVYHF